MIIVVTGQPGNGKTLWTIAHVEAKRIAEARPVYYHGISELTLDWQPLADPHAWYDLPPQSIVVIDECFKIWPPRKQGASVPKSVEELATHRHLGIDLYVIVQHPQLLDIAVRKLAGRHFHVVRTFGQEKAKLYQWERCVDPQDRAVKNEALVTTWQYPKDVYSWYKSAEVHTVKKELPWRMILKLVAIFATVIGLAYYAYRSLMDTTAPPPAADPITSITPPQFANAPGRNRDNLSVDPEDYRPSVAGLPWTAPAYRQYVQVKEIPVIAGCLSIRGLESGPYCRCADQQGNAVQVPLDLCNNLVQNGIFDVTGRAKAAKAENLRTLASQSRNDLTATQPEGLSQR